MPTFKDWIAGRTAEGTPVDADELYLRDDSGDVSKRVTWAGLKSALGTDDKAPLASPTFTGNVVVPNADADAEALNRITADGRFAPIQTDLWINPEEMYATTAVGTRTEIVEGVPGWDMGDSGTAAQATLAAVVYLPAAWVTYNVELWWTNLSANSGNVGFQCNSRSISNTDTIATPAFGVNIAIAAPSQYVLKVSTLRSGVSATSGAATIVQVARVLLNSTLNGNAGILGLRLVKAS